jgi:hypothetical protein
MTLEPTERQQPQQFLLKHRPGTLGGIAGVYNRFGYDAQMRDALETWSKHVEKVTTR